MFCNYCFVTILLITLSLASHVCHTLSTPLRRLLKTSSKPSAAEGRDSSSAPAHKRPVRPILPAYCSTAGNTLNRNSQITQFSFCGFTHWLLSKGRTLVHIFAVPPEKAANNNSSLSGNHQLISFIHFYKYALLV